MTVPQYLNNIQFKKLKTNVIYELTFECLCICLVFDHGKG